MIHPALKNIQARLLAAAIRSGRNPENIQIVAVSKNHPVERIRRLCQAGHTVFGENRVQEAQQKIAELPENCRWHLIGHLQTNKARQAVQLFELVHSVDSLKLANELNRQAQRINKIQHVLIQVNLSGESTKSGVSASAVDALAEKIACLDHLKLDGFMTIPPFEENPEKSRPYFRELSRRACHLRRWIQTERATPHLSMGMSHDFEIAVEEGATLVRIGTALFGERTIGMGGLDDHDHSEC